MPWYWYLRWQRCIFSKTFYSLDGVHDTARGYKELYNETILIQDNIVWIENFYQELISKCNVAKSRERETSKSLDDSCTPWPFPTHQSFMFLKAFFHIYVTIIHRGDLSTAFFPICYWPYPFINISKVTNTFSSSQSRIDCHPSKHLKLLANRFLLWLVNVASIFQN